MAELDDLDERADKDLIEKLVIRGDFIFFLDGYDEIPSDQRENVVIGLQEFITKARKNLYVMTSRPEASLSTFAGFTQYTIKGLSTAESFVLIRKYDDGGHLGEELIAKLREPTMLRSVKEFLANPLLVSLLYKSYEYKSVIPFKKHIFYRQVYDSLFENHDLTKSGGFVRKKASALDIEDFHRVLRSMAFKMVKLGRVEFDRDALTALIREARSSCPNLDFKEAAFLNDLTTTVPLFRIEADQYRWAHKSIQEYFAAQFICIDAKGAQDDILLAIYESANYAKYLTVLDLCYDIDYPSFRRTILFRLASDFVQYHNDTYVGNFEGRIPAHDLEARKSATFQCTLILPGTKAGAWAEDPRAMFNFVKLNGREESWTIKQFFSSAKGRGSPKVVGVAVKSISSLITLLARKHDGIAVWFEGPTRDLPEFPLPSEAAFQRREPTAIDEDPDSPWNAPIIFSQVTQALRILHPANLVFSPCLKLRADVRKECESNRSEDKLLSDI